MTAAVELTTASPAVSQRRLRRAPVSDTLIMLLLGRSSCMGIPRRREPPGPASATSDAGSAKHRRSGGTRAAGHSWRRKDFLAGAVQVIVSSSCRQLATMSFGAFDNAVAGDGSQAGWPGGPRAAQVIHTGCLGDSA